MGEIGRELPAPRPRRRLSAKRFGVVLTLLVSLALAALSIDVPENGTQHQYPERTVRISYITHDPILIDGNAGFTNASGVVWGSGTESDPYIIEGWDINASTANGIEIRNTDAHFIVRACHVCDGRGGFFIGIYLDACANGTLDSNTCSNNWSGIFLSFSNDNTLSNNTCSSNNEHGISVWYSNNHNIISNNTCSNNGYGMWLYWSSGNTLSNNTCSNNWYGIWLYSSSGSTLSNNTCSLNYAYGIALGSSSDSTLSNNTCSNNELGIELGSSSGNTLSNNTCSSNNEHGISVWSYSNHNIISNTTCSGNLRYGIYIDSESGFNTIWNNSFYNNNGATDTYDPAHIQAYDDGIGNIWNSSGSPHGFGNHWSDWTSPDANMDGIVDFPYEIGGNAGAKDWYPLTEYPWIPEFSSALAPVLAMLLVVVLMTAIRRNRGK